MTASTPTFSDRLAAAVREKGTPAMIGLDPRAAQLPAGLMPEAGADLVTTAQAYDEFCRGVIDVVAPLVPVVKPQVAFFEALGPAGMIALANVIAHASRQGLIVLIDAKRNDIGSTAQGYAEAWLGPGELSPWGGDALTVSPYLGGDSLEPFVEVGRQRGAGIFVLVKTSNPGGGHFQDRPIEGQPLYRHVAAMVEALAAGTAGECGLGDVGAVVGATYPEQLVELRDAMPHSWLLVPGFGSQGGTAADVAGAFREDGLGAVINNSRAVIFAHARPEYRDQFGDARWQDAVEAATVEMIEQLIEATPAGELRS